MVLYVLFCLCTLVNEAHSIFGYNAVSLIKELLLIKYY